ncbi:uncharacterized protein A4U43_C04F5450 [Asparagus officinalis]|uniref:H(+)/Pi cotransporter n=1 Tax=Asparagus officinalis TaxID=4686 RepID=A0A5P1EZ00_ASPOF|nr:uncharacterized protein A4U43_C04F5450 [Asparagus officinalis]
MFDSQNTLVTIFSDAQPQWRCVDPSSTTCLSSSTMCGLDRGEWEWVGGNKSSTIAQWGLICGNKFKAGVPASLFFIGSLLGTLNNARQAGRRLPRPEKDHPPLLPPNLPHLLPHLPLPEHLHLRLPPLGSASAASSSPPRSSAENGEARVVAVLPVVYSVVVVPFVCESPRWLAIKGRRREAMEVLMRLARVNGRKLPANLAIYDAGTDTTATQSQPTKTLWSAKWATVRVIKVMLAGFGIGFVYYGVQLNVENLSFNLLLLRRRKRTLDGNPALLPRHASSLPFTPPPAGVALSYSSCLRRRRRLLPLWHPLAQAQSPRNPGRHCLKGDRVNGRLRRPFERGCTSTALSCCPDERETFAVSLSEAVVDCWARRLRLLVSWAVEPDRCRSCSFGGLSVLTGWMAFWLPETKDVPLYETVERAGEG